MNDMFRKFAHQVSIIAGNAWAFLIAVATIIIWGISGPAFGFSDTWQLVINTSTTIVTFLMVFLIQNTQNRESKAIQLKLDELVRSIKKARDQFIDLEDMSDDELARLEDQFRMLHDNAGSDSRRKKKSNSYERSVSV